MDVIKNVPISKRARPLETVLSQDVDGLVVILDLAQGEYYGLNEVGSRIWTLLSEGMKVSRVLQDLVKQFDISEDVLESDLNKFLSELGSKNIVEFYDE